MPKHDNILIKRLLRDPEAFLVMYDEAMNAHVQSEMDAKTTDWNERNPAGTVSGSSFATCVRQAWYRFFTGGDTSAAYNDAAAKKKMWMGFVMENEQAKVLDRLPGILHINQQKAPVNLTLPQIRGLKEARFSATTDFVKELEDDDKSYFIPIELKSTQLYPKNWAEFTGWPHHLRQLLNWIYYAKHNGMRVPYGLLHYIQRGDLDTKDTIVAVDVPFRKIGRTIVEYEVYDAFIEKRVAVLVKGIKKKELPVMPTDVPRFLCAQCTFVDLCYNDINPFKEGTEHGNEPGGHALDTDTTEGEGEVAEGN